MTTRKHKPAPVAAKKRPSAPAGKPVKTVAAEKTVAVASVARDKDRSKPAAAPKKSASDAPHLKPVEIKAAQASRPPEAKPRPGGGRSKNRGLEECCCNRQETPVRYRAPRSCNAGRSSIPAQAAH